VRVRVPPQASTKWWILLAALVATLLTLWQLPPPRSPRPPSAEPAQERRPAGGDLIELELITD
jgi:hypothetical protein